MRDLYKLFDKLSGTKAIVSFHFKSFPVKPFYLTIHDEDSKCHMYEAQTMDDLEKQVMEDWSHLVLPISDETLKEKFVEFVIDHLPSQGMPKPPGIK